MKNYNDLELLDVLNIVSFVIGLMNYNENLTQGDKQDLMEALQNQTSVLLEEVHEHLTKQDEILSNILEVLKNDSR